MPDRLAGQPDGETPEEDAAGKTEVLVIRVVGAGSAGAGSAGAGVTAAGAASEEVATGATTAAGLEILLGVLLGTFSAGESEAALDTFSPAVDGVPSLPAPAALIAGAPAVALVA